MEKISAACAMEWSIELEKGLRSKIPGVAVDAILKIGPRLERWDREPQLTMAAYSMFGLLPGEDRLFANAILLRLADAFRLGDKDIRVAVVKMFLSGLRNGRKCKKRGHNCGILSKITLDNHLEFLQRVKVVYDNGDGESRAFSLIVFGCWADFAKDIVDIRYLILSSLVSSDDLEIRAALFAAGCFCQLSDDFTSVVLEILINMVNSSQVPSTVKLVVLKTFQKLQCSSLLTKRTYKACAKLVQNCPEENLLSVLLISLSKLACRSTPLISEQVDLLFSFVTPETALPIQVTALKCLHFILVRGFHFPVTAQLFKVLVTLLEQPELSVGQQCEGLRILQKIFLHMLPEPDIPWMDILEYPKLFEILKNSTQSPVMLNRLLATCILMHILAKLGGRPEIEPSILGSACPPSEIISLLMHRMTSLVLQTQDVCQTDSEVEQEGRSLLKLLLDMVEERPDLCTLVLDNIYLFIEYVVNMHDTVMDTSEPGLLVPEISESKIKKSTSIRTKLLIYLYRFVMTCLEFLFEAGLTTTEVLHKLRLLVEHVHQGSIIDWYTRSLYSLLLQSRITRSSINNMDSKLYPGDELVEQEILSLESAKKMLAGKEYWSAYRAGMHASHQGAWVMAAYIFEQLMTRVQSHSCHCWFKFLAQFSHSERKIYLLFLPKVSSSLDNWSAVDKSSVMLSINDSREVTPKATQTTNLLGNTEMLWEAYSGLCFSKELLEIIVRFDEAFYFQRWFLSLRSNILETVLDTLGLLTTRQGNVTQNADTECSILVKCHDVVQQTNASERSVSQVALRFKRLAQECDVMVSSFIGMDRTSSKIISALALSCSVLAFSTQFALFPPNIPADENFSDCDLKDLKICSRAVVLQDFVRRLSHVDQETSTNLELLLKVTKLPKSCYHLPSRSQDFPNFRENDILQISRHTVTEIIHIQHEANRIPKDEIASQITKGDTQLLSSIIKRWLCIPFQVPKNFFQFRPLIRSELFVSNSDTRNPDNITISQGFHLSLNLCLQLKNMPPNLISRMTKLYCILHCKTSLNTNKEQGRIESQFRAWESDDLVDLNQKLLHHVTRCTKISEGNNNKGAVNTYACFDLNERGQGFSTCLLDVSIFPVGSYRIHWLSCCIDKQGQYWSLIPLNAGPVFTVRRSSR